MSAEAELRRLAAPHVSWLVEIFMHSIPTNIIIISNLREKTQVMVIFPPVPFYLFIYIVKCLDVSGRYQVSSGQSQENHSLPGI